MNCELYRSALIGMARGAGATPELAAHLTGCRACRTQLDRQLELTAAMSRVASEALVVQAPLGLEQELLTEFSRVRKPRVPLMARPMRMAMALIAAGVILGMTWAGWVASHRGNPPVVPVIATSTTAVVSTAAAAEPEMKAAASGTGRRHDASQIPIVEAADQEQPFIEVPYTLPADPDERADLMQVEMPVSALIAAGMPVGVADPAARARADVIVGVDGRARAFRIISVSTFNSDGRFNHE